MNPNLAPPSLDTWTVFFLLAAGQGLFFAFILFFHKQGNRQANFLLGIFILFFALTLVDYVGFWTRYNTFLSVKWQGFYQYPILLFGPLLYHYFKSVYGEKLRWQDALHLLPFLMYAIFRELDGCRWFPSQGAYFNTEAVIFVCHLSAYIVWCAMFLNKKKRLVGKGWALCTISRRWHLTLLWLYAGFVLGWLTYYILIRTPWFSLTYDYGISIAMTVFIYAVGYLGYRQPAIFSGQALQKVFLPAKYQNSALTPAAGQSLLQKLLQHMQQKQPYLDNDLRLSTLASQMDVSVHHLSQVINEHLGKSFSDFINEYRAEEARKMLLDPKNQDTLIIDVAYSAGFNNKTTFNKSFKQLTGVSPSEYRKGVGV